MLFTHNSILYSWHFFVIPDLRNDVILGIDWLTANSMSLDCISRQVRPSPLAAIPAVTPPLPVEPILDPHLQALEINVDSESVSSDSIDSNEQALPLPRNKRRKVKSIASDFSNVSFNSFSSRLSRKRDRESDLIVSRNPRLLCHGQYTSVPFRCAQDITCDIVIKPNHDLQELHNILIGNCLHISKGQGSLFILNMNDHDIRLSKNAILGRFEKYEASEHNIDLKELEQQHLAHLQHLLSLPESISDPDAPEIASLEDETRSPETQALLDQFPASEHHTPTQKEVLFQLLEKN